MLTIQTKVDRDVYPVALNTVTPGHGCGMIMLTIYMQHEFSMILPNTDVIIMMGKHNQVSRENTMSCYS